MGKKKETISLIDTFSEFNELKNIDKATLISVLEEAFRNVISKTNGTDENYDILRAAFRKTERKVIGALCLGDYGDSRAIALLKGYLDRNGHALDRETFYESMSVIQKLGGDISDINDPFGDFRRN